MARTNLKPVSVYMTEEQWKTLTDAAALENRSLSNFLLTLGLQRAEEMGVTLRAKTKKAVSGRSKGTSSD